ncbi:hypothetical protein SAMN05216353_10225 [Halobacillus alkaliphilus]|uniref:Uncharacterized protein n=1 Tax=Halobacillus alkaliphilus TaxID=396056 RepID=A0A1I2JW43_9BACI|nr:hypothetical protein SAMN05216353_10225 [Halobacillus alkaliphilus]
MSYLSAKVVKISQEIIRFDNDFGQEYLLFFPTRLPRE